MKIPEEAGVILPDEKEYPRELTEKYELIEMLSEGENTRTLKARNRAEGSMTTVKCFFSEHAMYGRKTPEAMRKLNHPSLPRFVAEYQNEKMRCVLYEYVEGDSLSYLGSQERFSPERIAGIGICLCEQLSALHSAVPPIIHRDVKPQNIILREDGMPVLIDFGIARIQRDEETDTVIFGTRGFAAPEQYGYSRTDERSDIYSLGMVLHWLGHGNTKVPKEAETPIERVIRKMTAFDPEQRYQDAKTAGKALQAAIAPGRRRKRILTAMAAAACAALAIGGYFTGLFRSRMKADFENPIIEEAVRLSLGLEEGAQVPEDALEQVRGIYLVADKAYATPDEFYSAVNAWYAAGRSGRGTLKDLKDLERMTGLEDVLIAVSELEDISGLRNLTGLTKAEFKHNQIQDISPLAGKENLTYVGINDNPVTDLTPLLECPRLAFLDLCDVRNYHPEVIEQLGNFDYLDISNPTESYRYLGRKRVLSLRAAWTGLTDPENLSGVTRLQDLDISHTAVSDLAPLTVHSGLLHLNIACTAVRDLTPLKELGQLERVTLSEDMAEAAEQLGEVSFEIAYE